MLRPLTRWAEDRQEVEGPACPRSTAAFSPLPPSGHSGPLSGFLRLLPTHQREVIATQGPGRPGHPHLQEKMVPP